VLGPLPENLRRMSKSATFEVCLVQVKKGVEKGRPANGDMAIAHTELATRLLEGRWCLQQQDNRRCYSCPIRPPTAMEQDRVLNHIQCFHKPAHLID